MYFPVVNSSASTTAILMSTPHPYSWFDKFVENSEDSILKLKFERACPDCLKKDISEWQFCIHTKFEGALTKDFGTQGIEKLMNMDDVIIEDFGVSLKKDLNAFKKEDLEWMFNRQNHADVNFEKVDALYAYMDTNFGGEDRSTFYVTCDMETNKTIKYLIWASAKSCKNPEDLDRFLLDNIRGLRKHVGSYVIPLIIFYETVSNFSAYAAEKLVNENIHCNEFKNVFFAKEPNWVGTEKERTGVNVFGSRKDQFVLTFQRATAQKHIRIWKKVGTTSTSILKELNDFCDELSIFRGKDMDEVMKRKQSRNKMENKFNSGKMLINGMKFQDDRAFTFMAIIYFMDYFYYDMSCRSQRIGINSEMKKKIF